jgi:glyoxylase-like metal-dependent hydrolase (beta-lactamase superfamily II)
MPSLTLGDFELSVFSDGTYPLDGGAFFGVIPKIMWSRKASADERNYVQAGLNSLLIRTGKQNVLVETGMGNKLSERMVKFYGQPAELLANLAGGGIAPEDIDIVINTHLHFDHCGWNTTLHADGSVTPTFKNARYFAHAGEVAHGRLQLERDRVSYLAPNYEPLVKSGQMTTLDDRAVLAGGEICPGIWVELFPGHTAHMMGVHVEPPRPVESRPAGGVGPHACYIADLIPTAHHLDSTWVMGYDLDPLRCIEERKRFYKRAIPEEWLVLFTHDHDTPMARVAWNEKGKPVTVA